MNLSQIVIAAFLTETLLQTVKPLYDKEKGWHSDQIFAIIIGILVCLGAGVDLFSLAEIPLRVPYLGEILTGIIASRGSNVMHDIIKYLQGLSNSGSPLNGPVG